MPSQISGPGGVPPPQTSPPLVQVSVPALHAPTPEPQLTPPPGLFSSVCPLQLLSLLSQISVWGGVPPWQNQPFEPPQVSAPAEQGAVSDPTPLHVAPAGADHFAFLN